MTGSLRIDLWIPNQPGKIGTYFLKAVDICCLSRTQPPPTIPGGVHHKIAANCYFERDFRRTVPPPLTVADSQLLLSDKLAR